MDTEYTSIVFSSEIRALTEQNSSFDKGILRVCYTGKNRNGSYISKETFIKCINSIYNCPIVCRYDREVDTIGAHDVDIVHTKDGGIKMVNTTHPVGVIPTGAKYWWEDIDDGNETHEYLCIEALLWKRQEAYQKIKEDGIVDESMEIRIKESAMEDGILHITDFEFTAFCLLGTAEPCYESASLELFALDEFKAKMAEMMDDLKASFEMMQPDNKVDIDTDFSVKGGNEILEDKIDMIEEQETVEMEAVPAETETFAENEVVETEAESAEQEQEVETPEQEQDNGVEDTPAEEFALARNITEAICDAVRSGEMIQTDWGEYPRYWYVDHDNERHEVYVNDTDDWKLYGFSFEMNGDNVVIDWTTKKRKKFDIVDFDEGEQPAVFSFVQENINSIFAANKEAWEKEKASLIEDNKALQQFKLDTEASEVFAKFPELEGIDAFEALKNDYAGYSKEDLEEKCFAIKGRNSVNAAFSVDTKQNRIVVEKNVDSDEPYGGLFLEFARN